MLQSQSEMTICNATEAQEFGNDWGLFIELDVDDSKYRSKNKYIMTLDMILEEELAIENNSECLKPENTKKFMCCCFHYFSIISKTIAIACVLFYII